MGKTKIYCHTNITRHERLVMKDFNKIIFADKTELIIDCINFSIYAHLPMGNN